MSAVFFRPAARCSKGDGSMPLVPAKCTNCGADLETDSAMEEAVCPYCRSAYIVEKAINNYNTYVTHHNSFAGANIQVVGVDAENYIRLAHIAMESGRGQEAFDYARKALEIRPESGRAWAERMLSLQYLGTVRDPRVDEVVDYGANAVKYADAGQKEEMEELVYGHYLQRAAAFLSTALRKEKDTERLQKRVACARIVGRQALRREAQSDGERAAVYKNLVHQAIRLKLEIPPAYCESHPEAKKQLVRLAQLYVQYGRASDARMGLYGQCCDEETLREREKNFAFLTAELSGSERASLG